MVWLTKHTDGQPVTILISFLSALQICQLMGLQERIEAEQREMAKVGSDAEVQQRRALIDAIKDSINELHAQRLSVAQHLAQQDRKL